MNSDVLNFRAKNFSDEAWNCLPVIEQNRFISQFENDKKLRELGLNPPPLVVQAPAPKTKVNVIETKKAKICKDEDWNPYENENVKKKPRKFFVPPVKKISESATPPPPKEAAPSYHEELKIKKYKGKKLSPSQEDVLNYWHAAKMIPHGFEKAIEICDISFPNTDQSNFTPTKLKQERELQAQQTAVKAEVMEKSRYPRRSVPRKKYTEDEILNDDDHTFCDVCDQDVEGNCENHPYLLVINKPITCDGSEPDRARKTAPWPIHIAESMIEGAGLGAFTFCYLPKGLLFGPYEGVILEHVEPSKESGYGWKIREKGFPGKCIDAVDTSISNWLRYVNCSRNINETNLSAFQYKGEIYYRTIDIINPNDELLVWYGDEYGEEMGYKLDDHRKKEKNVCVMQPASVQNRFGLKVSLFTVRKREIPVEPDKGIQLYPEPAYSMLKRSNRLYLLEKFNENFTLPAHEFDNIKMTKNKRLQCNMCKFTCKWAYLLKDHMRLHNDEKLTIISNDKSTNREKDLNKENDKNFSNIERNINSSLTAQLRKFRIDKEVIKKEISVDTKLKLSPIPGFDFEIERTSKLNLIGHKTCVNERKIFGQIEHENFLNIQENMLNLNENFEKIQIVENSTTIDNIRNRMMKFGEKFQCGICKKEYDCRKKFEIHYEIHAIKRDFSKNVDEKCFENAENLQDVSKSANIMPNLNTKYTASDLNNNNHNVEMESKTEFFQCDLCNNFFNCKIKLKDHIFNLHVSNSKNSSFQCPLREYKNSDNCLNRHITEKPFKCNFRDYKSSLKHNLKDHISLHHTGKNLFNCNFCEYQTSYKGNLKVHIRKHTGEKSFKCNFCEYKSSHKNNLKVHISSHHTGKNLFNCNFCEYKTSIKGNLNIHIRTHTGENPFKCSFCDYKCRHKISLKAHISTYHTGEYLFYCNFCEYKTSNKSDLNHHIRKHTGEKPYKCNFCKYKSSRKHILKVHISSYHTGENLFNCTFCEYKTSMKGNLNTHIRTHTGENPFKCNFCDYKCRHKISLKVHISSHHTGENLFNCNFCEYKTSMKGNLNIHIRTHTGEKPFKCNFCDYKCNHKNNLKVHISSYHTGEKPFKCNFCDYKSRHKSDLKIHIKRIHKR